MKVTVFVPAHNEEKGISKAIKSLLAQSYKDVGIVVICDNCTDRTKEIAENYEGIVTIETINNTTRKAGALNQAFQREKLGDFVLIIDADTTLDKRAIEVAVHILTQNNKLGAVCSRAGVLPYGGNSLIERVIWSLQHIEYGQFDSHRVETQGRIKVAHGMATMFRTKAITSIPQYRKEHMGVEAGIFLEDNLVEDYELTLCLKHNWEVASSMNILAWTEVPVKVKELWKQRLRWLRGGVDTLRQHSFNRVTAPEIMGHWLFVFIIILRSFVVVLSIKHLVSHGIYRLNPLVLTALLFAFIDSLYRLKYVQNKKRVDYIVKFTLIPEMLFSWAQALILLFSYVLSFGNIKQKW